MASTENVGEDGTDVKDSAFNESICTWNTTFKASTSKYFGYVESVEEATMAIKQYELETTTKFSCFKYDKMFGAGGEI